MSKALTKRERRLKKRIKEFEQIKSNTRGKKGRSAFTKPGSMNPHKHLSIKH